MGLADYELLLVLGVRSRHRRLRMSELRPMPGPIRGSGAPGLVDRLRGRSAGRTRRSSRPRGQLAQPPPAAIERLRTASPTHLRGVACHFLDRIPMRSQSLRRTLERVRRRTSPAAVALTRSIAQPTDHLGPRVVRREIKENASNWRTASAGCRR